MISFILFYQFDELKDDVAVEQILKVVFLDVGRPSPVSEDFSLLNRLYLSPIVCSINLSVNSLHGFRIDCNLD